MEKAPASRPAMPESRTVLLLAEAPATPRMRACVRHQPVVDPEYGGTQITAARNAAVALADLLD